MKAICWQKGNQMNCDIILTKYKTVTDLTTYMQFVRIDKTKPL